MLNPADIRTIAHWIGPDYMIDAAKTYAIDGDPVMGALEAFKEVRSLARNYTRFMAHRDKTPASRMGMAMAFRAMGYVGHVQGVMPLEESMWRTTARAFWDGPASMPGRLDIDVGAVPQSECERTAIRAVSRMLTEHPEWNRANLQGRLYQRESSEVLVHLDLKDDDVVPVILDASKFTDKELRKRMLRSVRGAVKIAKHPLRPVGMQVLRRWAKTGFIGSTAGAMVSIVGGVGIPWGVAPLCEANGIPLTISVGMVKDGILPICLNADHRVFDARACGGMYNYLEQDIRYGTAGGRA